MDVAATVSQADGEKASARGLGAFCSVAYVCFCGYCDGESVELSVCTSSFAYDPLSCSCMLNAALRLEMLPASVRLSYYRIHPGCCWKTHLRVMIAV